MYSITALWKDGLCRRLDLERFSLAETTELVRSALGDDAFVAHRGGASFKMSSPRNDASRS